MQTNNSIYIEPVGFEGTKGNWVKSYESVRTVKNDNVSFSIAMVHGGHINNISYSESEANTSLLSQSKELLKALQGIIKEYNNSSLPIVTSFVNEICKAESTIKKALNKQ